MWKQSLIMAGVIATLGVGTAYANTTAVTADAANLRSGPSTQYHVVASVPAGARMSVQSCSGRWCKVSVSSESGYIARGLIAVSNDSAPAVTQSYVEPTQVYPDEAYAYEDSYPGDYAFGYYGYDGNHRGYDGSHRGFHGGFHGDGGLHGGFHGNGGLHGGFHGGVGGFHGGGSIVHR